jgi:hypothetical protein
VRWGTGPGAPREVVGTDDTTLALSTPAYGSTVTSPIAAGGTITGVDEQLMTTVRQSASSAPLGVSAGVPAGGSDTPWSTAVPYGGATEPVLAIVVQTGVTYKPWSDSPSLASATADRVEDLQAPK